MIRLKKLLLAPLLMLATILSTAVPPIVLTTLVVTQTACPRPQLLAYSKDALSAFRDLLPIFEREGIDAGQLREGISIAAQLVVAFENNLDAKITDLTAALITAFDNITRDAGVLQSPPIRIGLGLANVALHYISNHLVEAAPAIARRAPGSGSSSADAIVEFNQKKHWRCRNSQNGQFAKMEFCKAHPDVSVVEVY